MADLLVSPGPGPGPQLVPIVEYLVVAAPEVRSVTILARLWSAGTWGTGSRGRWRGGQQGRRAPPWLRRTHASQTSLVTSRRYLNMHTLQQRSVSRSCVSLAMPMSWLQCHECHHCHVSCSLQIVILLSPANTHTIFISILLSLIRIYMFHFISTPWPWKQLTLTVYI